MRLLLLPLLAPAAAFGQVMTDQFIELTVHDTIPLRFGEVVYELRWTDPGDQPYDENADWEKVQREMVERADRELGKLEKELRGMGHRVERTTDAGDDLTLGAYAQPPVPVLRITAPDQQALKPMVAALRGRPGVEGRIAHWRFDQPEGAQTAVLQAMFTTAEQRARAIATLAGRKLGKLLAAHEPAAKEDGILDLLQLLSGRDHASEDPMQATLMARQRSMVFRFALID
ncbi:MAG: hypothetical protein IPJ87_03905 [Flavobacteriales bacterium]|nr:hypothetical protein [Flavobacteriales bacterium]MBK7941010.1 hypothetical protein [Flavobacteriales bacterium]MBK9701567.1 hypothetical protein [Flavobacteriales bacterium]